MSRRPASYSPRVKEALEKKGFFAMSKEERISKGKVSLEHFSGSLSIDHEEGRRALREARGEAE